MTHVVWSPGARSAYLRFLREWGSFNPAAAARAEVDVERALSLIDEHPFRGRASLRWEGRREWSLPRQHKLLVYRVRSDDVAVVGFFDTRQDLCAVKPG